MGHIHFIQPEERYIRSYWETFDRIAKEKKYLASEEAFPFDSTVRFINHSIRRGFPQIFIIDRDTDVCVGWCDALPKTDEVGYLGMGLLPEYRERGIVTQVLRAIIEKCRKFGYKKIELDVLKSNSRAIHVYEKAGFEQVALITGGFQWRNTLIKEDVIQMSLEL